MSTVDNSERDPSRVWECRDKGHEFWCRREPGTCLRTGRLTCNDIYEGAATDD